MDQWLYKATPKKVELEPTRDLARKDGFICRSAYVRPNVRAARTGKVEFGAILHFYYRERGITTPIGSFEVIDAEEHPNHQWFGPRVAKTCLFTIADRTFEQKLQSLRSGSGGNGYVLDPELGTMVGWAVRAVSANPPPYKGDWFPFKTNLVQLAR